MEDYKFLEEKKVDFLDLLAYLILRWKAILCFAFIGCVLLGLVFLIKTEIKTVENAGASPKKIAASSASLSEAEALEVENTFHEYQIYQKYLEDLGGFSSVFVNQGENDGIIMIAEYDIVSRLENCSNIYTEIALSAEDYHTICQIAYPEDQDEDQDTEDVAAKRVVPVRFISEGDGNADAIALTVFIKADTEKQCNEILHVIDAAFDRESKRLKETDPGIRCRCVATGYSSEQNNFYDNAEKKIVERLDTVNQSLATLNNDHIEKFSNDQKKYFDVLKTGQKNMDPEKNDAGPAASGNAADETKKAGVSFSWIDLLKYLAIGFAAGFFLAIDILICAYVAPGRVNSVRELGKFNFQTLGALYFKKGDSKKFQLARNIRGITPTAIDKKLPMLAESISIMMKNLGAGKLYLLMTTNDVKSSETAGKIRDLMAENDLEVVIGNPLSSREELKQLAGADRVIIMAKMKETKGDTIRIAARACGRCSGRSLDSSRSRSADQTVESLLDL